MKASTTGIARLLGPALAALAVIALVLAYVSNLGGGFANSDEVIYAEFVRAMHRTGDWLTLRYGDVVVLQRPPAPIALYAAVASLIPGEAGLRLAPAILSAASAIAAGAIVWRRFGRLAAGLAAAGVCAAIPSVFVYGRMVLSDPPFVLCATLALGATIAALDDPRAWKWALAALGGAFATKSMAAVVPALALAPWLFVIARRHRARARIGWGLAMFTLLAAPYYVIGLAQHGGRFLSEHIGNILLERAAGQLEGIGMGGPGAYLGHVWNADGPVAAILLFGGVAAAGALAIARRDRRLGVAATYAAVTLVVLSAVGTRLPNYLLLWYPAAAVCLGGAIASAQDRLAGRRAQVAGAVAAAAGVAFLVHTTGQPPFDELAYPSPETEALARRAAAVTRPDEPVHSLDWYAPGLGYYADRRWRLLTTSERAARIIGGANPFRVARNVTLVPPWPRGRIVVAGPRERLERELPVSGSVLGTAGEYELREVSLP